MGGDWVINHNETTVSDEEDEAQLTDLGLTDKELDVIKGGQSGESKRPPDGGGFINNHNETVLSDTSN